MEKDIKKFVSNLNKFQLQELSSKLKTKSVYLNSMRFCVFGTVFGSFGCREAMEYKKTIGFKISDCLNMSEQEVLWFKNEEEVLSIFNSILNPTL